MLYGPVGARLVRMTTPVVFGIFTLLLFNLVDTFFVGMLGSRELAAVSFTFPVSFVVINVAMGIASATTSVSSLLIGRGLNARARRSNLHALMLAVMTILPLSLLGIATIDPLFKALGADEELLPLIRDFMVPWYAGVVLLAIPMTAHGAIRATGDTRTPSIVMGLAGLLNGILDPIFIFALDGGVQGAAIATVIAWAFASVAALRALHRSGYLGLRPEPEQPWSRSWRALTHVAGPAAITNLSGPIAGAFLTALAAHHGHAAVAALGVGTRIESLALVVVMALGSALSPFLGQHLGAVAYDRIREGVQLALRFTVLWGVGIAAVLWVIASPVARLFSDDAVTQQEIARFLTWVPWGYAGFGVSMIVVVCLNVLHRPVLGTAVNTARLFAVTLPMAWAGHAWQGLEGMFVALAVAHIITGALAGLWLLRIIREDRWLDRAHDQ